ncbi:hypothetical protein B566_EDAN014450 [Ephemera danica]|nr:hypothetical protein B566_EDAN014450 [Ephemera danica]
MDASEYKSAMEVKVKSHMHALKIEAERESLTIFNEGMTKETEGKLVDKSQMKKLHKKFAAAALEVFDKIPIIFGYKELIESAKLQCSKVIEASDYKSRMEEQVKHHVLTIANNSEKKCMVIYNDGMKKGTSGKFLNNTEMDILHKDCATASLKMIEASVYKEGMEEKVKSHVNTLQNNTEKECMMIFNNGMTKETNGKFLKNSEMDNLHKEFAAEALKVFDNLQHYGNHDQLKNAKLQCAKMIERSDFKFRMEEKVKHHVFTLKTDSERECMTIYNGGMTKGSSGKLLNTSEMDNLHKECTNAALKVFDKFPDLGYQDEIKDAKQQCLKMIESSDFKSRMEEKVKMQELTLINEAKEKCMEIYNDNMRKEVANKFLSNSKMEEIHTYFAASALEVFDNLSDFGCQEEVRTAKSKCVQMIEASDYKSRMEEKVKSEMNTFQSNAERECMIIYIDEMKRGTEKKLLKNAEMDDLHKKCLAEALKVFDGSQDFGNQEQLNILKTKCSKMMNATDFKIRMEDKWKMQVSTKIIQAKDECLEIYNENMKREIRNKSLINSEMEKVHMECAASALKVFDNLPDFINQEEIRIAKSKCSQLIEASDYMTRMEEKVKMESSTQLSQAKDECMEIYNVNMRRNTRDKFLKKSEMHGLHNKNESAALKVFENLSDNIGQEEIRTAKSKCSQMMEASDYISVMEGKVKDKLQKILEQSKNNYSNSLKQHAKNSKDIATFKQQTSLCRNGAINDFKSIASFADTELITELLNSLIQFMNQQNSECEDNFRSKRPVDELEDAKNTPNASPEENKADDLAKGLGEDALLAAAGLAAGPAAPYVAIIAGARAAARVFNNIFK